MWVTSKFSKQNYWHPNMKSYFKRNDWQIELEAIAADPTYRYTLPPAFYSSPEVFDWEKEAIFMSGWICLCREDQVSVAGDYLAIDVIGEPLVVVRDHHGIIRVLSNVCRHRWMRVCAGSGNAKALVCPYHAWTYHLDGQLRSAAIWNDADDPSLDRVRLPVLRHEIWQGFIYVNLDGNASPLNPQLDRPAKWLEPYGFSDWHVAATIDLPEYPWDWKVMQDNGECYHHVGAHRTTFESNYPARLAETEVGDGYSIQRSPAREEVLARGSDNQLYVPGYFTPVAGLDEARRTAFILINVFPNFFIYAQPDYGMNMRMFPLASGRIKLYADILVPPHTLNLTDFSARLEKAVNFFHKFNDEDVVINSRIQIGLESQFATAAPLNVIETHNRHFAQWVAKRLSQNKVLA